MSTSTPTNVAHDLHLHASDYMPDQCEKESLRAVVTDQDTTLRDLDARIAALEVQLLQLLSERQDVLRSSTVKRALLAPIRKLAPEIIGQIFELCTNDEIVPGARRIITATAAPILLSQVCKKWRHVALMTPQLWTNIALESTTRLTLQVNPFIVISEWLRRSGALAVDVYLGDGLDKVCNAPKNAAAFRTCMGVLGDEFYRCRSFHVTNSFPTVLAAIFPVNRCRDASLLRDFRVIPTTSTLPLRPLVLGQITAPNLESIDVYRPSTFFDSLCMDYSRLRHLRWNTSTVRNDRESSLDALAHILERCPNLEECEIVHPSHSASATEKSVVSVPSLKRLSLKFTLQADPSPLFSILHTPGLESLTLEQTSPISNIPGFGGALATFLSGSSAPLRTLRMTRLVLSADDAALFGPLKHVETLDLNGCFVQPAFLGGLTPRDGEHPDAWAVPRLETLSFGASMFPAQALEEVVQKRLAKPTAPEVDVKYRPHLKALKLSQCRLTGDDMRIVVRFAEYLEELDVIITAEAL
ncbi:hypothetical protein BU17DRAFT_91330 [Hysterangium stoloniferum]|nr:hypothetical protein BU17DRAFT_91330 [Hysterangium stoloniferum]